MVLRLRREKEQLLELGNRLRAQLGQPAGGPGWGGHRKALGLGGQAGAGRESGAGSESQELCEKTPLVLGAAALSAA